MLNIFSKRKCSIRLDEAAILEATRIGGEALYNVVNIVTEDLCKCTYFQRIVFKYVLNSGGTKVKAEDVLADGLLKTGELLQQGKYKGGQIESFAIGICKNTWLTTRRKKEEQINLTGDSTTLDRIEHATPATSLEQAEKQHILKGILQKCINKGCQEIFKLKITDGMRHEKIMEQLDLPSIESSRQKLTRCKKKAKACLRKHPAYLQLLASVDIFLN